MRVRHLHVLGLLIVFVSSWLPNSLVHAAPASPAVLKAKEEAEAKGYIFEINHDVILANAKKEGRLRVFSSFEPPTQKLLAEAFKNKYPFLEIRIDEVNGPDNTQRMLLEMQGGVAKAWDVNYMTTDFYDDYLPYQRKFDLMGMAQHGVLQIPIEMIDPVHRNIAAFSTKAQVVAYNKKLIAAEKVPNSWEDFLKPQFKGRKFIAEIRGQYIATLIPAWGLEKTAQFAKAMAAQQPIWVRGVARALAGMASGEYQMFIAANLSSSKRAVDKDATGNMAYKVLEPVPSRIGEHEAVFSGAEHPYAGLLWLEFLATPEAQKIIDQGSFEGSHLFPGTLSYEATRGKKLSMVDWQYSTKMQDYQKKIFEAFGFPKAEQ